MTRIYIFTGKGGVGKSSVATAHALKSAMEGKKTLLVSTDMAHNLGDIFDIQLGKEPYEVVTNLDVYELDPEYVCENDFHYMMESLSKLLKATEVDDLNALGMVPGTEELFSLLKIADIQKEGTYERIFVDCAPTGETLSLLKIPELLMWYMEKLFPIGKVGMRLLSPVAKTVYKVELPNKQAMNDIEKMYLKLFELQELFKDREITSIKIVTIPEKMVVEETKRNYMYMNLYDFNVDGIYINRILPKDINNAFFDKWLTIQSEYIQEIKDTFDMLPIYEIPWYDEELKGQKAIERLIKDTLKTDEVFLTKPITERENFTQNEKGYLLKVMIPGANKGDVNLFQASNEIVLKIGNFKRNIPLPNVLRKYEVTSAKFEEGVLNIQFEKGLEDE